MKAITAPQHCKLTGALYLIDDDCVLTHSPIMCMSAPCVHLVGSDLLNSSKLFQIYDITDLETARATLKSYISLHIPLDNTVVATPNTARSQLSAKLPPGNYQDYGEWELCVGVCVSVSGSFQTNCVIYSRSCICLLRLIAQCSQGARRRRRHHSKPAQPVLQIRLQLQPGRQRRRQQRCGRLRD